MAGYPIVLDVFWNKELNGGSIEDTIQYIDDTLYVWNCHVCGNIYKSSIWAFLSNVEKEYCHLNKHCPSCDPFTEDSFNAKDLFELCKFDETLYNMVIEEYSKVIHKEQEVIVKCPICGKYHVTKMRAIRRKKTFVCLSCTERYGGKKIKCLDSIGSQFPELAPYWGKNKHDIFNTYPLAYSQPFNLVCDSCGIEYTKSYDSILKTGASCEVCVRRKSHIKSVGSLRDNYPEVADMYDKAGNAVSSSEISSNVGSIAKFYCDGKRGGLKPHIFESPVYSVVASYDKGSNGCPYCSNKRFQKGINDVKTLYPEIAECWDYELNADKPEDTWYKAINGRSYLICPRCGRHFAKDHDMFSKTGAYCGICTSVINRMGKTGSLFDLYPDVAEMWDNGDNDLSSDQILPGSNREGYFYCDGSDKLKPHKFMKSVSAVVAASKKGNKGCPVCTGFSVIKGINDFETMCPNVSKEWDYERNELKPSEVYYNSGKVYAFKCDKGHRFSKDLLHMGRSESLGYSGCPVCAGKQIIVGENDLATLRPDVAKYWVYDKNDFKPTDVTVYSNKVAWFRCVSEGCNKEFQMRIDTRSATIGFCPECRESKSYSDQEKELSRIIRSWGFTVLEEQHLTHDLRSYDLYIPEKNIAIEYNGLYWHSEKVRTDPDYHFKKVADCQKIGIELLYVWDDDYTNKKDIVLKMLKRKLGVANEEKVNARDCVVSTVGISQAKEFLYTNHIQGFVNGSLYLGLWKGIDLVAVMILEEYSDLKDIQLKRYATSCNVRGGFSKLLSSIDDYIEDYEGIYTFSDNCISRGQLYASNGFEMQSFVNPDYSYIVNGFRKHKFGYRKEKFKNDPNLKYKENLTEGELAELNGLIRVYDAGKIKWYKRVH